MSLACGVPAAQVPARHAPRVCRRAAPRQLFRGRRGTPLDDADPGGVDGTVSRGGVSATRTVLTSEAEPAAKRVTTPQALFYIRPRVFICDTDEEFPDSCGASSVPRRLVRDGSTLNRTSSTTSAGALCPSASSWTKALRNMVLDQMRQKQIALVFSRHTRTLDRVVSSSLTRLCTFLWARNSASPKQSVSNIVGRRIAGRSIDGDCFTRGFAAKELGAAALV